MLSIKYSTILNQNIKIGQEEITNEIIKEKQKETPDLKKISKLHNQLKDIENYKKQGTVFRSKEKIIIEQEQANKYFFDEEKTKLKKKTVIEVEIVNNNKINKITNNLQKMQNTKNAKSTLKIYTLNFLQTNKNKTI